MVELFQLAKSVQTRLDALGLPNVLIGGLALQRWGESRLTRDADFTLLTYFEDEKAKIEQILERFEKRIPNALEHAMKHRVLLLQEDGVGIDIGLGGFPYEMDMIDRGSEFEFSLGETIRTASAEDIIVQKVFAGRDHDWSDVRTIIIRQQDRLDWQVIDSALTELLELIDDPARLDRLHKIREEEAELDKQDPI